LDNGNGDELYKTLFFIRLNDEVEPLMIYRRMILSKPYKQAPTNYIGC
jgi:hypothetical protein